MNVCRIVILIKMTSGKLRNCVAITMCTILPTMVRCLHSMGLLRYLCTWATVVLAWIRTPAVVNVLSKLQ